MRQQIANALSELVALEQRVAAAAARQKSDDECRVYEWRPSGLPELPAIWNWIDDGTYEIVDTARSDDVLVVTATIGVKPSDLAESMGKLVRITDVFREVVDPELGRSRHQGHGGPLKDTVRYAKRVVTRSEIEDFDGIPVMCMSMLIRLELTAMIR
jgi:hypothetical protein